MKLCKDCNYNSGIWCSSPKNGIDVVNGGAAVKFAPVQRDVGSVCGPDAVNFLPKVQQPSVARPNFFAWIRSKIHHLHKLVRRN